MTDHLERARAILAAGLEIDANAIAEDASIMTLEAWDSLGHIRIITALEEIVGRELPPEKVAEVISLPEIAAVLGEHE